MDSTANVQKRKCAKCGKIKPQEQYSIRQWNRFNRKCKQCTSLNAQNTPSLETGDNNIPPSPGIADLGSQQYDEIPTHLFAHDDGTWYPCKITQELPNIGVQVVQLFDLIANDISTYHTVTPNNAERLRPYDPKILHTQHNFWTAPIHNNSINPSLPGNTDNDENNDNNENNTKKRKQVRFNLPPDNINDDGINNFIDDTNTENQTSQNNVAEQYTLIMQQLDNTTLSKQQKELVATIQYMQYLQRNTGAQNNNTNNIGNNNKNDEKDSTLYTKMLWEDKIVQAFTIPFPTNPDQYYTMITALDQYRNENITINQERLLNKVVQTLKPNIRNRWNTYKQDKFQDICEEKQYTAEQQQEQYQRIHEQLNTFREFENFMKDSLRIEPTIEYFQEKLHHVRVGWDENPNDSYNRFRTYFNQIRIAIDRYNIDLPEEDQLEHITDKEKMQFFKTKLEWDNNKEEHKNNGPLNKKVKTRLATWWRENKKPTMEQLRQKLDDIQNKILPVGTINEDVEGEHWKRIPDISIFKIKPITSLTKERKRKLDKTIKTDRPPTKRRKIDRSNKSRRCKFKDRCQDYIRGGKCSYYHIAPELTAMQRIRNGLNRDKRDDNNKRWKRNRNNNGRRNRSRPRRNHGGRPTSTRKTTSFCRYGDKCTKYQDGTCTYKHDRYKMSCSFCKKVGHPKVDCYRYKQTIKNPNKPQQYNPYVKPNADIPTPHALPLQTGSTLYQFVPVNPSITTPTIKDEVTLLALEKQKKIEEYNIAKQQQEEIKQQIKVLKHRERMTLAPNGIGKHNFTTPRHQ